MSENYDVVIAGAGPAGAQCARDLAARDYEVLVLETESEAEFPRTSNKSTAGTFPPTMTSFGIPDEVVMNYTDRVVLESPSDFYDREQTGAVLEFAGFKNFLVDDSRADGAQYRFDARVTGPILEDGRIVGVEYDGSEEVYGDIVVDATGPSAILATALGVSDLERSNQAIGVEYELQGVDMDHDDYADLTDAMMLRLDHSIAPGGYSWIFHTGADTAKVGICYIKNDRFEEHAKDGYGIDDYLEEWLETDPRFADAERLEGKVHRGSAHIQLPTGLSTENFMAIGDTVPSVDPVWGEGIDNCMRSGRAAAVTADYCLSADGADTSAETMSFYEGLWHDRVAPKAKWRLAMAELLYLGANDRYDELMRDLRRLDDDTLKKANNGDVRSLAKLLGLQDIPLLVRYARQRLGLARTS